MLINIPCATCSGYGRIQSEKKLPVRIPACIATGKRLRLGGEVDFFFSSRRRHTRFDCDWSSDVCSSDLGRELALHGHRHPGVRATQGRHAHDSAGAQHRRGGAPAAAGRGRSRAPYLVERQHPHGQGGERGVSDLERRFEEIIRDEISRRRLLRRGAAGALGVSALSFLAACGEETGGGGDEGGDSEQEAKAIPKGEISDSLYFANWPLYIEEDRGTLKEFEQE